MGSTLAAFALLIQLLLAVPCTQAAPQPAAAHAHCQAAGEAERPGPPKAPAATDLCCKCVAAAVAAPPAPSAPPSPSTHDAVPARFAPAPGAPSLRAIASGPPSQAPPVSI